MSAWKVSDFDEVFVLKYTIIECILYSVYALSQPPHCVNKTLKQGRC